MPNIARHLPALTFLAALACWSGAAWADPAVSDQAMAEKLLGTHAITLQWLGTGTLKDAGKAEVKALAGEWHLTGRQDAAEGSVEVDGIVTFVDATSFGFKGKIVTQVTHINGGKACSRDGEFVFFKKGKRKYWRMQSIDNPCDVAADYVDIYLR
ncbi:hypothetical protein [Dongia rigui]|uniref:DUF1579 domain-containing protein n=1 Tax=Dongia rigui TaxID=940149 RepID=A0ABU5E5U8_9PROT|nr:hypothetical protein [Dongia rigui]MDY0874261.1 hypothetical protein [Dongia rigui]